MTIILTSDELEGVSGYRSSKRQLAVVHIFTIEKGE